MSAVDAIRKGARDVAWYVRGILGEDAYDKYAAHHERLHQQGAAGSELPPILTEREFWRDHTDRQDTNPQGRCC